MTATGALSRSCAVALLLVACGDDGSGAVPFGMPFNPSADSGQGSSVEHDFGARCSGASCAKDAGPIIQDAGTATQCGGKPCGTECKAGTCSAGNKLCVDGTLAGQMVCAEGEVCGGTAGHSEASCSTQAVDSIPSDQVASSTDLDTRINVLRVDTPRVLKSFSMPGATGSHVWLIYEADAEVPGDWTSFKFIWHAEGSGERSPDINLPLKVGAYYAIGLLPITKQFLLPSPIKGRVSFAEVLGSYSPFEQGIGAPGKPNNLLSLILSQPNFGFVQTIGDTMNAYAMELETTPPCTGQGCIPRPSALGVECDRDWDCVSGTCLPPSGSGAHGICVTAVGDACADGPEGCQYDTGNGQLGVCVIGTTSSACAPGCTGEGSCANSDHCTEVFSSHTRDCTTTYLGRACILTCTGGMCPDGLECTDSMCVPPGTGVNPDAPLCSH